MSRVLKLPDKVYAEVESIAAQEESSPAEWIARQAAKAKRRQSRSRQKKPSLYEQIKDLIGKYKGVPLEEMKEDPNDPFFNYLLKKKREGRL